MNTSFLGLVLVGRMLTSFITESIVTICRKKMYVLIMWLDKGQQFKRKNSHRHYRYFHSHHMFVLVLQIMIDNGVTFQFNYRPEF